MKQCFKRAISIVLVLTMLMGYLPLSAVAEQIHAPDAYILNNGFLEVSVSAENGAFNIRTAEGDKLNKDDNNKNLLFPSDNDNTSFTSFRVERNGDTKDYIFGGKYSFLGLTDQAVTVTQDVAGITATWGVDDLKFTQRIELSNTGSNNHGMAYISYTAETTGAPADISARILMDTALGYQDFAIYEMSGNDNTYTRVEKEAQYSNSDGKLYEKTFFAYDDVNNPTILAYTVNASVNEQECVPEKVAFGHWNNLASSVFDFTPDPEMTFTNPNNKKYLTADSAYALYYDIGMVSSELSGTVATYYGVYSNEKVSNKSTVAVNLTAPPSMTLSPDKKNYEGQVDGGNPGDFKIQTYIENYISDTSVRYENVKVAVYCQTGIKPLDDDGVLQTQVSYADPYTKEVSDFKVDETKSISWKFNAAVGEEAGYRKVHFKVYNVSPNVDPTGSGQLLEENLLGEGMCYILCPGGDGKLPEIKFTGSSPEIIYNQGTRHVFMTGSNFSMLENKSEYRVIAEPESKSGKSYIVPAEQFLIDTEENTIDVVFSEKMDTGNYELVIDYTDAGKSDIYAPAMKIIVSDDEAYRNDGYGVLAIVQKKGTKDAGSKYEIKTFGSESAYDKEKSNLGEVLIELKGEFSPTDQVDEDGTILKYTGVSTGNGRNVMTVNNCIDVENGNVTVTIEKYGQDNQAINVDFDAELYTTGARTTIWKSGISALTSIVNGNDYELITYDKNGKRPTKPDPMADKNSISLIWPSAGGAAQTIGGMIFNFRYGELGVIKDSGKEIRRVLAFGALLDLCFLIPNSAEKSPDQLDLFDKINLAHLEDNSYTSEHMRSAWEGNKDQVKQDEKADRVQGAIKVKDILFGGEYIGFNTTIELEIQGYTPAMPNMAAKLTINTIGNWEVGVAGKCKFTTLEAEAEIIIKSKDGYPVPDKLYFFIKGFKPGVNIDGFGVVWLQGGGGGIDKLYDTIFASDSIPPLKILLSAQLSIMQAFSAKADLSLSLRGIGIKISNGVITDTDIKVLNHSQLQFDWYPEFYFMASMSVSIFDIITGGGYIVVESDGFFEFYVNASVNIPEQVMFIGGMHIGSVYLGANSNKIWGGIEVIGIHAGICYYWGGDLDFGLGKDAPQPSFPELLGVDDIPVYTDPETGRVLYMHVGTNFELMANAELVDNINSPVTLMDSVTSARVSSKADKSEHVLNLGARQGGNDAILSISYNADTKDEANEIAKKISIIDSSSQAYDIKMYNPEYDANATENSETNANLTYNSSTGKASLNVTFTHEEDYDKEWKINTPDAPADLLLYNVLPMAGIDSAEVSGSGDRITASWIGSQLEEFESLSFMAIKNSDDTEGTLIYKTKDKVEIKSGTTGFDIPDSLETGTYHLKVTAIKEGELCETAVSSGIFSFENTKLPSPPASIFVTNGGDYQIDANVEEPKDSFDGYRINIYEKNEDDLWVLSEAGGMSYKKDAQKLSAGGRYSYTYESEDENGDTKTEVVTRGLEPGRGYKLGVSTYREDNSDPDKVLVYYSPEIMSDEVVLSEPQRASIEISASESIAVAYSEGKAEVVYIDTYKSGNITFSAQSDQKVYGTWTLDGGDKSDSSAAGIVNNSDDWEIPLKGLEDGNHIITFIGTNTAGDGVLVQKRFAVDTLAPRLLLEAPLNGGFFEENGNVEIKGITDLKAIITINGTVYLPSVSEEDGSFSQTVNLDKTAASNEVTISASDDVGNTASRSITVINKSLGKVQNLKLYADGSDITNKSLTQGDDLTSQETKQLILKAETSDGSEIVLNNSSLVSWDAVAASGSVSVDGEGTLTMTAGARGMVIGKLMVSDKGSMTAAAAFGVQNEGSQKDAGGDGPSGPGGTSGTKPVKPEEQPQTSPYDAFTDVEGHWAQEYIKAVVEKGLFKGVTENLFAPELGMTRGMFVTVLGRMENANMHDSKTTFVDVDSNMYYAPYVTWATEQNIVKGADGNRFLPEILISREQISVLLYRYAVQKGYNTETEKTADMEMFKDYRNVSSYAEEAMKWAVSAGIMQGGDDGGLHPSDNATRAEVAAMIIRFIDMYVK
ncbi:hypothetical protein J2Z76_002398 [Sedimentibacter acidaminivorans]|uniref:SLH domain-containing protein n=1 Tax=Sedimentibacter acidaminivorans TaxID=913099 RepID=A0ABS4GFU2_9FIRM|nr:S-layer homology domain-containing protein [Sedimentibacter acidaminivorans]MBP1926529.1 hypothetical protein [Sedimentibacter acidaminivorans]